MTADKDKDKIEVSKERLARLVDVFALISIGSYDEARDLAKPEAEDDLGAVQEALRFFIAELAEGRRAMSAAIDDLTASRAELELKLATIEEQRDLIRRMSTPVLELADDILTLPVVGVVDSERASEMTEALLSRIVALRAKCAIIDVTGMDVSDSADVEHIFSMARTTRMLGARCVIVGLSPHAAQSLAQTASSEMLEIATYRNLKDGLRECRRFLDGASKRAAPRPTAARSAG